jgi:hypothetical protein
MLEHMDINYIAILVATVVQFIIGAIWYMPLFGNLWGKMHGFEKNSPEAQAEMRKGMLPLLVVQFIGTLVTSTVFVLLLNGMPYDWNRYGLVGFMWLGFVVPTQVSAVLFGGTPPQWIVKKILVMSFGSLACLEALAFVVVMMG